LDNVIVIRLCQATQSCGSKSSWIIWL